MQPETSAAIREIWEKVNSPSGLAFPQTVGQLTTLGVTRYHIDYVAATVTAYIGSEADVAPIPKHGDARRRRGCVGWRRVGAGHSRRASRHHWQLPRLQPGCRRGGE